MVPPKIHPEKRGDSIMCGTLNGGLAAVVATVATIGFLGLGFVMIYAPARIMSYSNRYDAWLSKKVPGARFIMWPRVWFETWLDRLGLSPWIIRAWGVVLGSLGLFLLGALLVSVFNPCSGTTASGVPARLSSWLRT